MEWRPMETAPKDGTPVLLAVWAIGPDMATAAWNGHFWDMRYLEGDDMESASADRFNREFAAPSAWLPLDALSPPGDARNRAPEGMPAVIAVAWIAGCAFGALVTAFAGWMW